MVVRLTAACCVALAASVHAHADESPEAPSDSQLILPQDEFSAGGQGDGQDALMLGSDDAAVDHWLPPVEGGSEGEVESADLRPIDWMRHWGLRHSSTHGRFVDKSEPLAYSSWLNRPYHVDWFVGPLLTDSPDSGRVGQTNEMFGGLRVGWDFDYYWGVEWRFGWADPEVFTDVTSDSVSGRYFVSDVDFVYYPWGDTRVRPYFQLGLGVTELRSLYDDGSALEATLLSMPLGVGVQFPQTHWLAWRLEIIDNLAFGSDGVDTMQNIAFTAGMEIRLGARPNSYWPWRSSRTIW